MAKKRRKRYRLKKRAIILIETICLIVAECVIHAIHKNKVKEEKERVVAEESAKQQKRKAELKKWNLLLVNEWNAIPDDYEIETAEVEDGYVVDERICDALKEMLEDCRDAGYSPIIISSFRTREKQQYLYDHTAYKADTALPGHSEHECGLAADIIDAGSAGWSDPLIDEQEDMPAQKWLMEHCQDYGFILRYPKDKEEITGIIYEPWHYRYVGKKYAKEIMEKGLCLEEYIEQS
jgi:D-alanyl-D-alanine carboxypeptidase